MLDHEKNRWSNTNCIIFFHNIEQLLKCTLLFLICDHRYLYYFNVNTVIKISAYAYGALRNLVILQELCYLNKNKAPIIDSFEG